MSNLHLKKKSFLFCHCLLKIQSLKEKINSENNFYPPPKKKKKTQRSMSLKRKKKSLLLPLKSDKNDNNKKTLNCYSNNLLFLNPHVSLCISNKICKNDSIINSEVCFQKKKKKL